MILQWIEIMGGQVPRTMGNRYVGQALEPISKLNSHLPNGIIGYRHEQKITKNTGTAGKTAKMLSFQPFRKLLCS